MQRKNMFVLLGHLRFFKQWFVVILFLACSSAAAVESSQDDSIKQLVARAINDSARLKAVFDSIYPISLSRPKEAIKLVKELISVSEKEGDYKTLSKASYQLAVIHDHQGSFDLAIEQAMKALRAGEIAQDSRSIARALIMLGRVNITRGITTDLTLDYFNKAEKCYRTAGSIKGIAVAMNWVGNVHYYRKEYDQAKQVYLRTLALSDSIGYGGGVAYCTQNLASIAQLEGKNVQALAFAKRSLQQFKELRDSAAIAYNYKTIGFILLDLNQAEKAIKSFNRAIAISERIFNLALLPDCYEGLANAWFRKGDHKKAFQYSKLRNTYMDSLFTEQSQQKIHELEARYENEKKQTQIRSLTQEKAIQQMELGKKDADLKRQFAYIISFTVVIFLLILLSVVVLRSNRQRKRDNHLLNIRNKEIATQKEFVEMKNKDISDSIHYARRIQNAILPSDKLIKELLPESFVLYKPKDVVSGDFYWIGTPNTNFGSDLVVFAVADCTGHGVPGGFLSMVGYNYLLLGLTEPEVNSCSDALGFLNKGMMATLQGRMDEVSIKDGMDIVMCAINHKHMLMEFSGARRPLCLIREKQLIEFKGDKISIGETMNETAPIFNLNEQKIEKGDCLYLFSDGYPDQFGGPRDKKFSYKRFKELLLDVSAKPMDEQKQILDETLSEWTGDKEQIDDICVMGVKII